jgi:hypothetical protein
MHRLTLLRTADLAILRQINCCARAAADLSGSLRNVSPPSANPSHRATRFAFERRRCGPATVRLATSPPLGMTCVQRARTDKAPDW